MLYHGPRSLSSLLNTTVIVHLPATNSLLFARQSRCSSTLFPLFRWFANNYKRFGTQLEFITDRSQEGSQFNRGFGGIGGVLRWAVDFMALEDYEHLDDEDYEDEYA